MSRNVSEAWRLDHPWSAVYSRAMSHPRVVRAAGRIAFGTNLDGLYDAIATVADVPEGGTVLDVPCGSGIALNGLARRATPVRYLAADIAPTMLKRTATAARHLGLSVETLQADVAHLPLADRSVDLTLSLTGLHCFPDPEAAVHELARVTKDRIELTWLRSDAGLRYRPILGGARLLGVVGPSASAAEVAQWLSRDGFHVRVRIEGSFAYLIARRLESPAS